MTKQGWTAVVSTALFVMLIIAISLIPVPFVRWSSGPAIDLLGSNGDNSVLQISGANSYPATGELLLRGSTMTAAKIRRYMLVRTAMSVITGLLVWAFARAVGLQLAEEWGFIAFSLNYIPFLGPLVATVFPTLFAMTQFGSWQAVIAVFACLNLIQFIVGSYIEPRVAGSALSISPAMVLFSVFFLSYLWGVFGAFIGVPITIALVTYCAQHPSSAWLAELFGAPEDQPAGQKRQELGAEEHRAGGQSLDPDVVHVDLPCVLVVQLVRC